MDTRADVELEYKVSERGYITSPGKFEGEPYWLPIFWDRALDGMGEQDDYLEDDSATSFILSDEDREMGLGLERAARLILWEDCQGFVRYILKGQRT